MLRLQVLAVGTSRNDIICFDRRDGTLNTIVVTQGHSAAVSGLALDPASPSFATAGDDKTLRCVERTPGPQIATTSWLVVACRLWCLQRSAALSVCALPAAGRAVAISPQGDAVVVGLSSGGLQVHDPDSLQVTYEDRQLAAETISDLAFSPSGDVLAVASHDNNVYLLAANEGWRPVAALKGHSSYVTHVDWSEDGAFLQVRTSWLFLGEHLRNERRLMVLMLVFVRARTARMSCCTGTRAAGACPPPPTSETPSGTDGRAHHNAPLSRCRSLVLPSLCRTLGAE